MEMSKQYIRKTLRQRLLLLITNQYWSFTRKFIPKWGIYWKMRHFLPDWKTLQVLSLPGCKYENTLCCSIKLSSCQSIINIFHSFSIRQFWLMRCEQWIAGCFFFHYNRPSGIYIVHTTHINWIMSVNLVMANEMNISNSLPNISSGLILQNQMHATTFQCPFSEEFFNLHSVNCK